MCRIEIRVLYIRIKNQKIECEIIQILCMHNHAIGM